MVVNSDARPTSQMRIGPFMEAVAKEAIVGAERAVHFLITVIRSDVTQFQVRGLLAEHVKQASRVSVPEPRAAIERYRCNSAAVVTERHALQLRVALVAGQPCDFGSVRYVPKGGNIVRMKLCPTSLSTADFRPG